MDWIVNFLNRDVIGAITMGFVATSPTTGSCSAITLFVGTKVMRFGPWVFICCRDVLHLAPVVTCSAWKMDWCGYGEIGDSMVWFLGIHRCEICPTSKF
jgi:hypothetical protein